MSTAEWMTVATLCALGAMSPGPSLAVILGHTVAGGRARGLLATASHTLAIAIYALITVTGLAAVLNQYSLAIDVVRWGGALFLLYLGIKLLFSSAGSVVAASQLPVHHASALKEGFFIAFLNPKVLLFFAAVFGPNIALDGGWQEKAGLVAVATVVDFSWYFFIVLLASVPAALVRLQRFGLWLDRLFGLLLVGFALRILALV